MNKLNVLVIGIALIIGWMPASLLAQDEQEGIQFFEGSWEEAMQAAQESGKIIFVDVYTTWCGPCKKLSRETFKDAQVGTFHNKNFINFKMDAEKGDGLAFRKKYQIKGFPSLLYIDGFGQVVHSFMGFRPPDGLLAESRKVAIDEEQVKELDKAFEDGNRDPDFLYDYIENLLAMNQDATEAVEAYFATQEEQFSKKNMELIFFNANDVNNPLFEMMLDNKALFDDKYGSRRVNQKIEKAIYSTAKLACVQKDKSKFDAAMQALSDAGMDKDGIKQFVYNLEFYKSCEEWNKYAKVASSYLGDNEVKDHQLLNNVAWAFYEHIDKKSLLKEAESWALQSVRIKSDYFNNDTYAALLYKVGKTGEAILAAEKAIAIAKYKKKDYTGTQALLDKMLTE